MHTTILVGLAGHDEQYRLDDEAYERLTGYLDAAASGVPDDADRAEVLGDLERSIGDRLAGQVGSSHHVVTAAEIDGILEAIGTVDTGRDPAPGGFAAEPRGRRFVRIREGQQIAGVCTGLAAYAEVGVDWVRTGFVLATLVTAGLFTLVYVALVFIMPVVPTRESHR